MLRGDILLLVLLVPSLAIRVLSTGRDVATHEPSHSGAELLHSSLVGRDTVTICARFNIYQFTHRGYEKWPCQVLLSVGDGGWFLFSGAMTEENDWFKSRVGNNWIAGDNLLFNYGNPWKVEWRPAVWNSACIAMSTRAQLI